MACIQSYAPFPTRFSFLNTASYGYTISQCTILTGIGIFHWMDATSFIAPSPYVGANFPYHK